MWLLSVYVILFILLTYLTIATVYNLFLAVAYFIIPEPKPIYPHKRARFAILVPAHNEEMLIEKLCDSLLKIHYPQDLYQIIIVADNCTDSTTEICSAFPVRVMERNDTLHPGKGHAISWALGSILCESFDAVLIVDADNIVDPSILEELNLMIERGEQAIQCHNAVGNRNDSWFTQLLYVSRTIGNHLYHHAKYKLGLSSYLMGNGICFITELLRQKGWTAFSIGEDWEYYAQLTNDHVKIGFALNAKVFHQESKSLEQATTQRLRWSSGRFHVLKKYGIKLFWYGLIRRDFFLFDASLPLILPNYSLQINLTILILILSVIISDSYVMLFIVMYGTCLIIGQAALFILGIYLAKSYKDVLQAILYAPFFLIWKGFIDFLSITGIYHNKHWIRTARHVSSEQNIEHIDSH